MRVLLHFRSISSRMMSMVEERFRSSFSTLQTLFPELSHSLVWGLGTRSSGPQAVNLMPNTMVSREASPGPTASHVILPQRPSDHIHLIPTPTINTGYQGFCLVPFWVGKGTLEHQWEDRGGRGKKPFLESGLRSNAFLIETMKKDVRGSRLKACLKGL